MIRRKERLTLFPLQKVSSLPPSSRPGRKKWGDGLFFPPPFLFFSSPKMMRILETYAHPHPGTFFPWARRIGRVPSFSFFPLRKEEGYVTFHPTPVLYFPPANVRRFFFFLTEKKGTTRLPFFFEKKKKRGFFFFSPLPDRIGEMEGKISLWKVCSPSSRGGRIFLPSPSSLPSEKDAGCSFSTPLYGI